MRLNVLRTFITYLLIHIHQKKKITLEIAAKIVNGYQGHLHSKVPKTSFSANNVFLSSNQVHEHSTGFSLLDNNQIQYPKMDKHNKSFAKTGVIEYIVI
jgi:hypothetical protein